jgi:HEPN domain-containing protein
MTQEEKYAYWRELAQYDLDTADAMYAAGRWFYVAFMCQQAIEKLCKGLYNFYIDDEVPRVHNIRLVLSRVQTRLSIAISPETYSFVDNLAAIYLKNRYPDIANQQKAQIDKERAAYFLEKSKEVFAWLLTLKQ